MTVFESLKNREGLMVFGAASFVVIGAMRLGAGELLVVGVALVSLSLVVNQARRRLMMSSGPSAQSRNG